MLVGGLGAPELIVILIVLALVVGVPIAAIVALILFLNKRKH